MSERRIETVRVGLGFHGARAIHREHDAVDHLPRAILIHLAPNEPTIGEMAVDEFGHVFRVESVEAGPEKGMIWWDDVDHSNCTLHTPPETVDGVPVEDLRAVLDAREYGDMTMAEALSAIDKTDAAAARLRKKIEGADK